MGLRIGGISAGVLASLKFLATDRLGIAVIVWALIAFGLRPLMLEAHGGARGDLFEGIRNQFDLRGLARATAMTQWLSFVLAVGLAVMAHLRLGATALSRAGVWIAAGYAVLFCLAYVVFLWSPASVFTSITHDSFIFFDSTYRIGQGQRRRPAFQPRLARRRSICLRWARGLRAAIPARWSWRPSLLRCCLDWHARKLDMCVCRMRSRFCWSGLFF